MLMFLSTLTSTSPLTGTKPMKCDQLLHKTITLNQSDVFVCVCVCAHKKP